MFNIYILKCDNNKYYVGKTKNNINKRLRQHFNGTGSLWTKKYKPIELIEEINYCDEFDEDKYVKKYMSIYGIDNVRGGSYSQFELTEEQHNVICKELYTSSDVCYNCGKIGHFIKFCPNNKKLSCKLCGRKTHNTNNCLYKYDIKGKIINI
tara:strand:- start:549 stop:1004 length:456 start_codon:yes stop_codon:yes gene_type:complete